MLFFHAISNIKNSARISRPYATVKYSKYILRFLDILYREGFIEGYKMIDDYYLHVYPAYMPNGVPLVNSLKVISKPSRREYVSYANLLRKYHGRFAIISTSQGLMTGTDAIKFRKGGELVCLRYYY